jgi:hypothetical protein
MSVATSIVLNTARTFLNDDAVTNWTDAALMPKLQQAHRELQVKLRRAAAPVMKGTYVETVNPSAIGFATPPADLIAPIQIWENAPAGPITNYQLMTEADPLPNVVASTTLVWWAWVNETVVFIGSSASRMVKMLYWRRLTVPQSNTDLIGFIDGELYLAPRTAAIAYGSTGDANSMNVLATLADGSLSEVILSNRGRAPQVAGSSAKP